MDKFHKVPGDYLPDRPKDDPVCPRCDRPMSEHDADPIGEGLVQYSCPDV